MRSITDILGRFKQNWTAELSPDAITQACRETGMTWHDSLLNPVVTIQIFFLQVLHGNTAIEHLSHLTGLSFTAAAYCKARMRIKLEVFCLLLERCVEQLHQKTFESGSALIYNMVRQVMLAGASRQGVDVRRISFIDALRCLQSASPGDDLTKLVVNPYRPNRLEPRVIKRRPKSYPLMTKTTQSLEEKPGGITT